MRLTLRTLLAYLDNTLEPHDAEALRNKLGESGFATQLVQRIRGTLNNASFSAPSPQAVGPVEEANVISEYLDSTLPSEQVAEIERACLESDPHLAEAAACHQILTMVLGKPAEVSPALRKRIYELPDRKIEDIAAGAGSFSSVAIPAQQPLVPLDDAVPTRESESVLEQQPVTPVGVGDSGVSDAPTRIRDTGDRQVPAAALAGSKQRELAEDARIYGRSIRPSRITPWLVSLALAGVLLFALTQIFQPLLSRRTASVDSDDSTPGTVQPADLSTDVIEQDVDEVESNEATEDDEPAIADTSETTRASGESTESDVTSDADGPGEAEVDIVTDFAPPPLPPVTPDATDAATTDAATSDAATSDPAAADESDSAAPPIADDVTEAEIMTDDAAPPVPPPVPPPADEVVAAEEQFVARVASSESLLAAMVGDQWVRLNQDAMVSAGVRIVCAPTFRGRMELEDAEVTLVGPAQIEWITGENDALTMRVDHGRILVTATKPDTTFRVELGNHPMEFSFPEIETVAAASVKYFRAPGFDPLVAENRLPLVGVLSVQGGLTVISDEGEESLETGQQWVKRGTTDAKVSPVDVVPTWVEAVDPSDSSLEASARSGLMELLKSEQPLEIALREATLFRRSEVGSLAGRTLLNLGRGDVYFGGDGILSNPKQRAYWPDHYLTLLATVDRSAESAAQLRQSIVNMDSANAKPLFRLLTGYSQKQLVEGADQALVELLDSSSMAVRVLALENLHKITGTTLYFRAEQENAIRREPMIKKWEARLRKGDIRWQE